MIPTHTQAALNRYVNNHIPPGGFLTAVLTNNLFDAIAHADKENILALKEICQYVYNEIPGACWGSKEKMHKWTTNKGNNINGF